jgi:peroxiredoxin
MTIDLGPLVGTQAPDFSLPQGIDSSLTLSDLVTTKPTLLLFYPSDFGMMCSIEMRTFQDRFAEFDPLCHLIGISTNSVRSHGDWSIGLKLQFPLLSDLDGQVSKEWGLLCQDEGYLKGRAYRAVFLIDTGQTVRFKWVPDDASYEPDYDQLLEELRKL